MSSQDTKSASTGGRETPQRMSPSFGMGGVYRGVLPDPEGTLCVWSQVEALIAERDTLRQQIDGDGSYGPDAVKSLGLRKCLELDQDHIALLKGQLQLVEAQYTALRADLLALVQQWREKEKRLIAGSRNTVVESLVGQFAAGFHESANELAALLARSEGTE